ncbi:MAG TPA: replication protein H, partial [Halobacteriales archaeon]|nr:replication protein H [Halobacteriales archaeon]
SELGSFGELDEDASDGVVTDEEYLAGAGIDVEAVEAAGEAASRGRRGDRAPRPDVVREALRELSAPSEDDVVAYAAERDVPPDATRELLGRLVEAGEASEDGGRYRLL